MRKVPIATLSYLFLAVTPLFCQAIAASGSNSYGQLVTMLVTFGLLFSISLLLGLIPAKIAHHKGRKFVRWWIYSTFLFLIALIHSIAISGGKKCPHCAEVIKTDAKICRFCGKEVSP